MELCNLPQRLDFIPMERGIISKTFDELEMELEKLGLRVERYYKPKTRTFRLYVYESEHKLGYYRAMFRGKLVRFCLYED